MHVTSALPVPAGICGKNSRKLAQEIAAESNKKCDEKCGMMQNLPGIRGIICRKLRIWAKSRNLLHRISTRESYCANNLQDHGKNCVKSA